MIQLLAVILLVPLVGGALLPLWRFPERSKARGWYLEAVVCLTSALVWWRLLAGHSDALTLWPLLEGQALAFRLDGLGRVFAGLAAALWPFATLYAFSYMEHEERANTFFSWYTISYGVTLAVALSANLLTLYLAFECLTLVTLPLVWHKQDEESLRAAKKYALYVIGGAALGFAAMCIVLSLGGGSFTAGGSLPEAAWESHRTLLEIAFLLAFLGFGVKAAVFPFSGWLPSASVAPTPVTALLHAVAVVNAGAFAVMRVTCDVFGTGALFGTWAQTAALALSCVTVLYGSAMAVKERHLKRRLAWSTVSNLSYMLVGTALMTEAGLTGALCHLVFHGLMKITLFFCAGAILVQTGREYVSQVQGLYKVMPLTCAVFTLASVALVGTPPLVGFISKWQLLTAAAATGLAMGTVAEVTLLVSSVLTAVYLLTVVGGFYFRPYQGETVVSADPDWRMRLPLVLLSISLVVLGLWSGPLVSTLGSIAAGL